MTVYTVVHCALFFFFANCFVQKGHSKAKLGAMIIAYIYHKHFVFCVCYSDGIVLDFAYSILSHQCVSMVYLHDLL